MAEPLADQVVRKVKHAAELYHRLILVVAPAGEGKTSALKEVRERAGASLINVNLELSRRMLNLTERQRALRLPRLLMDIVNDAAGTCLPKARRRQVSWTRTSFMPCKRYSPGWKRYRSRPRICE